MKNETVQIKPPNMQIAKFGIRGTAPLVIHRFSLKSQQQMKQKMIDGSTAKKGKAREPVKPEDVYEGGKYKHKSGWEGFNAASIRCAMISACRLVGFKMTLAKLSLFSLEDGRDALEPQYPLIKIDGKSQMLEMWGRVETGQAYIIYRPMYEEWSANLRIRFDADQFKTEDVANLISRVGVQVGIGEGRPDSPNSAGMGWGTFEIVNDK